MTEMTHRPRSKDRVLVAIDRQDQAQAAADAASLKAEVGGIKLGLEFFMANGPAGVAAVAGTTPLFLDLKLHDIPNTVAGAVRSVLPLKPLLLTIHAGGGPAMLRAAVEAARQGGAHRPRLIGVTVLTSLDDADLAAVGQIGPAVEQVVRLARLARACGLDGVVCSPHEVQAIRAACGPELLLVVPGIRPASAAANDQKRVMTPADAVAAGADYLVIGRPILAAPDPVAAARQIAAEIAGR